MAASAGSGPGHDRLKRLLSFVEQDPTNLQLLADAAECALDAGDTATATQLLDRYAAQTPLPPQLLNLRGHVALQDQRYDHAAAIFRELLPANELDTSLRFNLAWSLAMQNDFAGSGALLDDATIDANPRAASLLIEALHHQGLIEEALERGADLAARHPADASLMGALATAALDIEQRDLALQYAEQAADNPDGLSTLGMLALENDDPAKALPMFQQALASAPNNPRALLGEGLVLLSQGNQAAASHALDGAAERFGTHLGTWVAAGWSHFVQGDYKTSRARFEAALAVDDTFAETHGGLAVLDVVEGHLDEARRRTEIAFKLDRACFSAALARSMLLAASGDEAGAGRVLAMAMNAPIAPGGRTLAQALSALATAPFSQRKPR